MAEQDDSTDESQKTEEPTARKLEEARKRGQVVHSREINNWMLLFAATSVLTMAGPGVGAELKDILITFLSLPDRIPTDSVGLGRVLRDLILSAGGILILPLAILTFAGAVSSLIQTGPLFTLDPIKPDLSKISIFAGFGRLFSGRSVAELVKGLLKLGIISIAGTMAVWPYFGGMEHFVGQDPGAAMFDLQDLFLRMMIAVLSILFVLAVLDYLYQRETFMKQMRMSKQEQKDEFKQTEGDPHVKGKLRQLREKKARQRMMQAVPEADVVITNPTHFAVALKYDPKSMDAPTMVAKGADFIAQKIKELAKEHKIPVVENPILARALFSSMEIDQTIPAQHWKAVAEVISYVFKLKGQRI